MNYYRVLLKTGEKGIFGVDRDMSSFMDMIASGNYGIDGTHREPLRVLESNVLSVEEIDEDTANKERETPFWSDIDKS